MRIVSLTFSVSRKGGGLYTSTRDLSRFISQFSDTKLDVLSLKDDETEHDMHAWNPIRPQCFPVIGLRAFGYAPDLKKKLYKLKPDLIHIHGIWMYFSRLNLSYSRRRGIPYLISPHGMLDPWAVRISAWKKRLAGWFYEDEHLKNATCLHALCDNEAESFREFGLKNPICIIPNGIYLPERTMTEDPPWKGKILEGSKVLLFLGRIHPKKGLVPFLKAWATAKKKNWRLVIIGWSQGNHEADLKELAVAKGCENSVLFTGPMFGRKKAAALTSTHGFVLPSYSEGLPISVLEAWSYGLPVLMTEACNLPEGFQEQAALKLDHEEGAMTGQLEHFLNLSDIDRNAMGERGRNLVAARFEWENIAAQIKSVYEWVVGSGPRPDCVRVD